MCNLKVGYNKPSKVYKIDAGRQNYLFCLYGILTVASLFATDQFLVQGSPFPVKQMLL